MSSIPDRDLQACKPGILKSAKNTAYEFCIPWYLEDLRQAGLHGVRSMVEGERYDPTLGTTFAQQAWRWIQQETRRVGSGFQASERAGEGRKPSDGQIREALVTFSAHEWAEMIACFERDDLENLRSWMRNHPAPLEEKTEKREEIGMAVARRGIHLSFRGTKLIRATDALEAALMRDAAASNNRTGVPRPPGIVSWDHESRPPAISRRLGTSRFKAEQMLKRAASTSFEKFAEEYGGSWFDYLLWSTDPIAYRRQRK